MPLPSFWLLFGLWAMVIREKSTSSRTAGSSHTQWASTDCRTSGIPDAARYSAGVIFISSFK